MKLPKEFTADLVLDCPVDCVNQYSKKSLFSLSKKGFLLKTEFIIQNLNKKDEMVKI